MEQPKDTDVEQAEITLPPELVELFSSIDRLCTVCCSIIVNGHPVRAAFILDDDVLFESALPRNPEERDRQIGHWAELAYEACSGVAQNLAQCATTPPEDWPALFRSWTVMEDQVCQSNGRLAMALLQDRNRPRFDPIPIGPRRRKRSL